MTRLSWVYLALGRNDEAVRLARQAAEWVPVEKDAVAGPLFAVGLAQVHAQAGEAREAVHILRHLLSIPAGIAISVNRLKLDPVWDPIRDDPGFQQLLTAKETIGRYPGYGRAKPGEPRFEKPLTREPAAMPEKSIAVLPFENMTDDKANAYFADGVQEEILTTLAKVADLKVISRTSVMQFRDPAKRDLREIARQLGVTYVLEGSVQRAGNRVRVSAQLMKPESGSHLWADRFDGELADVFGIQSAIAQKIVGRLDAVLSPAEQVALRARPTTDMAAYDLYLRARELQAGVRTFENIEKTVVLLDEAIARDPQFLSALSLLVQLHMQAYWFHLDRAPERLDLAKQALEKAARLEADAAEVHFARGVVHYFAERDFPRALEELTLARRSLPNDGEILRYIGYIARRQGQWQQAIETLRRAVTLDPRNVQLANELAATYHSLRQYTEQRRVLNGILAWQPQNFAVLAALADAAVDEKADFSQLETALSSEAAAAADHDTVANWRLSLDLWRRDYPAAEKALSDYRKPNMRGQGFATPREYY
ncbi:MAG TPA: FlgO family outer membrane protein, partial [Chthoniobacterales bacterium]|nr:FlgO family outer membrane protein [Chthoniobacterales bacterium]